MTKITKVTNITPDSFLPKSYLTLFNIDKRFLKQIQLFIDISDCLYTNQIDG